MKKSRISIIAVVASCSLLAGVYGQWGWIPIAGPYIDMAQDIASGDLGAIPIAGSYINLGREIASGNFGAIPIAGGYITMAREIASGNFGAIPYAGGYINMVANYANTYGSGGYLGYDTYERSIAENENMQPEYMSEGERMNTSEMGALFQAQEYDSPKWYEIVDMVSKLGDKGVIQTITPVFSYENLNSIDQERVKLLNALSNDPDGRQYIGSTNAQLQIFDIAKVMKDLREQRDGILELIRNNKFEEAKEAGEKLKAAIKESELWQFRSLPCDMLILSISLEYVRNQHRDEAEEWAALAEDYMAGVEMPDKEDKIKYWDYYATRFFINGSYSIAERLYLKSKGMREMDGLDTEISKTFLARLYQVQGRYEEAKKQWEDLEKTATDTKKIGEILTNLGINAFFLGDNIEAEESLKKAIENLEKASAYLKDWKLPEDRQKFVDDLNKKQASLPDNLNEDQKKEKESYEAATRELSQTPDIYVSSYRSGCCERLASIYIMQKRYDEAQKMIEKAEEIGKNVYEWKEDHKESITITKKEPVYGRFGRFRGYRDVEVKKDIWIYNYKLVEKPDDKILVSINAIKVQMNLKKCQEPGGSSKEKAVLLSEPLNLCTKNIDTLVKNKDVASAQRLAEAYKARSEVHRLIKKYGLVVIGNIDSGSAETDLLKAAEIIKENDCHETFLAEVNCSLGDVYLEEGKTAEAEKMFNEAEEICDEYFTSPSMYCRVYYGQAQVLHQQEDKIKDAIEKLEVAWDLSLLVRHKASTNAQQKAGIFGEYYYLYETLVEWQYDLITKKEGKEDLAKIYEAMERSRGQGLLDLMAAAGIKDAPEELKNAVEKAGEKVNEERRNLVELRRQARQYQNDPDRKKDLEDCNKKIDEQLKSVNDRVQDLIKAQSAVVENSRSQIKIPPFDDAVEVLKKNKITAFEYMVTEKGIYLFVYGYNIKTPYLYKLEITEEQAAMFNEIDPTLEVKDGSLTAHALGSLFQNENHTGIIDSLKDPGSDEVKTAQELYLLYTILFPDGLGDFLERRQRGEYAMILPDGVLSQFPFETLITNGDMEGFKDAAFLLEQDVTLFYSPSLEFYYHKRQNLAENEDKGVLTVGIKDYSAYNERQNHQKPQPVPTTMLAMRGADGSMLPDLPGAEEESREIKKIYGKNSTQLLNQDATEKNVRTELKEKKQSFHFAGHAQAMYQYGKLSGQLILYPDSTVNVKSSNDGFLTLEELCKINKNTKSRLLDGYNLVFLSACETNAGYNQQGEGTWSLSRGMIVAGAQTVISSNWPASDSSTSELVKNFFKTINSDENMSYAQALKSAKSSLRSNEQIWSHPFFWAPFVVLGNNDLEAYSHY